MLLQFAAITITANTLSVAAVVISGIAVLATIYFGHRSSRTAQRALQISEAEHQQRVRDRQARAVLQISFGQPSNRDTTEDGILLLDGGHGFVRLPIQVGNAGERESGRGQLDLRVPTSINDYGMRWCDIGGHELADFPQRASRVGEHHVLTRPLDSIEPGFTDEFFVNLPITVASEGIGEHLVEVRTRAASAGDATADFPFRIQRRR